jgi:hypothetical protein
MISFSIEHRTRGRHARTITARGISLQPARTTNKARASLQQHNPSPPASYIGDIIAMKVHYRQST